MADQQKQEIPVQPPLFTMSTKGEVMRPVADMPLLTASSSIDVACWWYKRHLEQERRPINTIQSYMYDLSLFQGFIGHKAVDKISDRDIANFLAQAQNKSTRKRRLTSIGSFFRFLIGSEKVLTIDPSDKFYPDFIPLKTPQVLFPAEQEKILQTAKEENSRTHMIVWFLLRLGLTRAELLALKVDHVDLSDPESPVVYVFYDDVRWQRKERKLAAGADFTEAYRKFLADYAPERRLFDIMPQSVNKLVDRVAAAAGINKRVTPQSLRDTYAVEHSKEGADEPRLLQILGLAPDSRNRRSVQRYIKLAQPAL